MNDVNEEYQYINDVHDKTYRKLLENKKNATRIINDFLNPEDKIKENQIEKYNSRYISDELKNMELSKYNILDINDLDNKELIKEENIISKLFMIEKSNTQKEFIKNLKEILKEINKKSYTEEEKRLSEIIIKAMIKSKFNKKETEEILNNLKFERDENMFRVEEMFKREERRFKKEGKIEIIKNMLREKEPINKIVLFSGMKKSEIEKIAKEMS